MALKHANPLDVVDLDKPARPDGEECSVSLLRTGRLQLLRIVLKAGEVKQQHFIDDEFTIQCLKGEASIDTPDRGCRLPAGHLVVIPAGEPYTMMAHTDATLLVTLRHHA